MKKEIRGERKRRKTSIAGKKRKIKQITKRKEEVLERKKEIHSLIPLSAMITVSLPI